MAAEAKPKPDAKAKGKEKTAGKGGGLQKKLGPLPVYAWIIAAVGAYLVYHFYVNRSTSATTPTAASTAGTAGTGTDTSGSTGGASGGGSAGSAGDASGAGFDAYASLVNTLLASNQANTDSFTKALAGGTSSAPITTNNYYTTPTTDAPAGTAGTAGTAATPTTPPVGATGAPYSLIPTPGQAAAINPPAPSGGPFSSIFQNATNVLAYNQGLNNPQKPVPASSPSFASQASGKTAGAAAAQVPVAFGGVANVKTLPNGSTLTTYASGRQVQQVPGKSAYVVKA